MKTNIKTFKGINLICILGIIIMILIPYTVKLNTFLVVSCCGIGILLGEFFLKKQFYLLYLAIFLCIPSGFAMYDVELPGISQLNKGVRMWVIYPLILLALLKLHKFKDVLMLRYVNFVVIPCILVCILQFLLTNNDNEYTRLYSMLSSGICILLMVYFDKKLTFEDFYKYITILFIVSSIYAILQFYFLSPYNFIKEMTSMNSEINRISGLLGHPLFLSFFVSFFQTLIFIRLLINNKINITHECICLITGFLTVSRVFILSLFVVTFVFLILSGKIKSIKTILGILFVFCLSYYTLTEFDSGILSNFKSRFENGDVNHRQGIYEIAFVLLGQNLLGAGYSNVMEAVYSTRINTNMLIQNFSTVDNLFLTSFIAYGIFSIFFILYYYYPLLAIWKVKSKNKPIIKCMILAYLNIFIYSCTLDWETSIVVSALVFSLSGLFLRLLFIKDEAHKV